MGIRLFNREEKKMQKCVNRFIVLMLSICLVAGLLRGLVVCAYAEEPIQSEEIQIAQEETYREARESYEYALFPMTSMNITQGVNGGFSHQGTDAIDTCGRDGGIEDAYAPFSGRIVKIYDGYQVWLESDAPVMYADGTIDYMTVLFLHDNDTSDLYVGKQIKQGEVFFQEGTAGNATGNHIHIECARGKMSGSGWHQNSYGIWMINNSILPYDALFITQNTNVINGYNYPWKVAEEHTTCEYGEWQIETEPTCTENGSRIRYCLKCGLAETEVIPSTGHSWSKTSEQSATCEEAGYINYQCANCLATKTETNDALGHDWQESGRTDTNCLKPATVSFECATCGKAYTEYVDTSAWSETYPEGIREDLIETKTQYRYQNYTTTTSYETSLSGYDRVSSQWTKSGSSTYDYVAAWPAGFDTGNSFYAAYNKSPLTNSETQTDKIVVTGSSSGGYLLWHWCRGTYYNGPINRLIRDGWASDFGAFHAFYSDNNGSNTNPEGNNGGGEDVRYYYNSGCCTDTYWYFATEVTRQSYDTYRNLFTYGKWDSWSDWSDTVYSASDTRNVETRTVYRYVTAPLGEHNWDKGVVTKEATCIADGVKTFTCSLCGETKTEEIPKLGHAYSDNVCTRCGDVLMTVKVGAAEACAGESVKIPVVLSDNDGFTSFTLEILSDDALTLMNISKGALLTSVRGTFSTTTDAGGGSVSWSGSSKITGDGVLMELIFTVSEDASVGAYAVNLKSSGDQTSSFMDENSKSIPMAFISGNVIVFPKTTFTLPGNVTRIEEEAFAGNTAIAAVELPSGVKSIGAQAFQNCSNMTMIVMGAGVTDIAEDAFNGCSKDLLFCCPAGSYAQAYAESHGFRSIAP